MATYGTSNGYINYSVNSTESNVDINSNTSVITVWVDVWRTNTGYNTSGSGTVYVWIDGAQYSAPISSSQKITSTPIRLCTFARTIGHNNDGSRSVYVSGQINHARFSTGNNGYWHGLTTIPRASSIDSFGGSSLFLDCTYTVRYTPKATFGQKLRVSIPNKYCIKTIDLGTQGAGQKTTTFTFTQSELETIYKYYPNSDNIPIGACIETYNGSSRLPDSAEPVLNLKIPTNIKPTFDSAALTPINKGNYANWGYYIQNHSNLQILFNNSKGIYNSTIKSYIINDVEYTASKIDVGTLLSSGNKTYKVKVKDSRGRISDERTYSINVEPYDPPIITSYIINRATKDGKVDEDNGTCVNVTVNANYSAIKNNKLTLTLYYKEKDATEYTSVGVVANNTTKTITSYKFEINRTYDLKIVASDLVYENEVSRNAFIETAEAIIDILKGGHGIGLGMMSSKTDTVEINENWNFMVYGHKLIDLIYPVGSQIYNSKSTFDPNKYYPGTKWVRIKGCVLAGINEDDKTAQDYLNFNKTSGSKMGTTFQRLRAWIGAYDSDPKKLGYGATNKVTGQNFPYGFSHGSVDNSIGYDRINHATKVTNMNGQDEISVIQPTQLTYIWERTA